MEKKREYKVVFYYYVNFFIIFGMKDVNVPHLL